MRHRALGADRMCSMSRLHLIAVLAFAGAISAQTIRFAEPARHPLLLTSPVQDKNFYLLSMMERTAAVRKVLTSDPILGNLAATKRAELEKASQTCGADLDCYCAALRWSDAEMDAAAHALRSLHGSSDAIRHLVEGPLRASGMFQRDRLLSGDELLARGWLDAARAINNIIDVYGTGKPGRYPAIDSAAYDVTSESYRGMVRLLAAVLNDQCSDLELFFQPSLRFALLLLQINDRDEAGRLEPLERGENAAAIRRLNSLDWHRYPYSVIVVPGSGPGRAELPLSPIGKLRLTLAAKRFRDRLAPLLLVSGGYVHPIATHFCEAVEMKRYLVAELGVPASAILIDPHARHTTTNLRNAARLIYRYGIPFEKMALITTDPSQSRNIESPEFAARCLREMGNQPYALGKRISAFDLEFRPVIDALQVEAMDPLDP